MRVYVPITVGGLSTCLDGSWSPAEGFAATESLAHAIDETDEDLLAELARDLAGESSVVDLLSGRRAVVVLDLPDAQVTMGDAAGLVALTGSVDAAHVACAFVDDQDAEADAKAAAEGDADALESLSVRDMLWYDVSEIPHLSHATGPT
jgi:hypothetical protein